MDLNSLRLDLDSAEDGVLFPFGETAKVKIAMWNNKKHKAFLRELYTKHGRKIQAGAINDDQASDLLTGQWPFILTGWEGITDDGEILEYSPQTVIDLAKNPQYKAFFARVEAISKEEENFRQENLAELGEL